MSCDFEKKVAEFAKANELFGPAEKILLAVSGGADSTALLYAMHALKAEGLLSAELLCAHINHKLRGSESDSDEQFAAAQADALNLPMTAKRLDVREFARQSKLSIETAARKLRIESLLEIAKAGSCTSIATAHHKNDNAETILQRLLRGTGFRGLAGIWPVRTFADTTRFVRPLLCVRRDEITDYLRKRNLSWREDRTNIDCTYKRNFIRHELLPQLQQDCAGSIVEQLSQLAELSRKFYGRVFTCAEQAWPKLARTIESTIALNLQGLLAEPAPVRTELIRRALTGIGCGEKNLTQQHYDRLLNLAEQNIGGKKVMLPGCFFVCRESGSLLFSRPLKISRARKRPAQSVRFKIPGRNKFGQYLIEAAVLAAGQESIEQFKAKKNSFIERFDLDKLKLPLSVRLRRTGERFRPLGLPAEKKIGKFLTAAKVPQKIRSKILIVADGEKIIWVWPVRISEQAKITHETKRILQLQITDAKAAACSASLIPPSLAPSGKGAKI